MTEKSRIDNIQVTIEGDMMHVSMDVAVEIPKDMISVSFQAMPAPTCSLCEKGELHVHDFFRETPVDTQSGGG